MYSGIDFCTKGSYICTVMRYNFTLNRSDYTRSDGTKKLYLQVNINGKRQYYPLNYYLKVTQLKGGVVLKHPDGDNINKHLSSIRNLLQKKELDEMSGGLKVTHAVIKKILQGSDEQSFNDFYKSQLNDPSYAHSSLTDQKQTLDVLNEFNPDIYVLDFELIKEFNKFLVERYGEWTVYKHHKNVKKFINLGIKMGVYDRSPYIHFSVKRPRSDKIKFLSRDELKKVEEADVSGVREYQLVKDMFLFSCYTGLRWGDVSELTWGDIKNNSVSLERMQKVDRRILVPCDELFDGRAKDILDRYKNTSERIFPGVHNSTANAILKDLATVAGVKPLTFHMARHTFGTLMAARGESIYRIMQLMGISKFETAQVYINLSVNLD